MDIFYSYQQYFLSASLVLIFILNALSILVFVLLLRRTKGLVEKQQAGLKLEGNLKKDVEDQLTKAAEEELKRILDIYQVAITEQTKEHFAAIEKAFETQLKTLSEFVKQQEGLIAKQTQETIGQLTAKAEAEIDDYKKAEKERIDGQVRELIGKVSKDILGKSISLNDHEDLVMDALDKAKKRGIFKQDGV